MVPHQCGHLSGKLLDSVVTYLCGHLSGKLLDSMVTYLCGHLSGWPLMGVFTHQYGHLSERSEDKESTVIPSTVAYCSTGCNSCTAQTMSHKHNTI